MYRESVVLYIHCNWWVISSMLYCPPIAVGMAVLVCCDVHTLEGVGRLLDWKGQMPSTVILSGKGMTVHAHTVYMYCYMSAHITSSACECWKVTALSPPSPPPSHSAHCSVDKYIETPSSPKPLMATFCM